MTKILRSVLPTPGITVVAPREKEPHDWTTRVGQAIDRQVPSPDQHRWLR